MPDDAPVLSTLIIGREELQAIAEAIALARATPADTAKLAEQAYPEQDKRNYELADRPPNVELNDAVNIFLHDYRLAVSFERQPIGLALHISISSRHRAREVCPHPAVIEAIANECGIPIKITGTSPPVTCDAYVWIEDFLEDGAYGGKAVNILYWGELRPVRDGA